MGCFNMMCVATGTTIMYGDQVYAVPLLLREDKRGTGVYIADDVELVGLPIAGIYDDYGWLEQINERFFEESVADFLKEIKQKRFQRGIKIETFGLETLKELYGNESIKIALFKKDFVDSMLKEKIKSHTNYQNMLKRWDKEPEDYVYSFDPKGIYVPGSQTAEYSLKKTFRAQFLEDNEQDKKYFKKYHTSYELLDTILWWLNQKEIRLAGSMYGSQEQHLKADLILMNYLEKHLKKTYEAQKEDDEELENKSFEEWKRMLLEQ